MRKVDLGFGCLGNGITVWDRAHLAHGDYATVAHIDPCGAVKLYDSELPPDALETIAQHAARAAERFKAVFLADAARDYAIVRWSVLQAMSASQLVEYFTAADGKPPLPPEELHALYLRIICERDRRVMPEALRAP